MKNLNPFIVNKDEPQRIMWQHFKEDTPYELELLLPFKAIIQDYRNKGKYLRMCARVIKDENLQVSELIKDQLIIFDFPLRTFTTAWGSINYMFRHTLNEHDNVWLTFKKRNRESISLLHYEKMQPTPDQVKFTNKYYVKVRMFEKATMNKVEEL